MTRRKLLLGVAVVLVVLIGAGAVFALTVAKRPGDISNNPKVEFNDEPTSTPVPDEPEPTPGSKKQDPLRNFVWAHYGYSQDRRPYEVWAKTATQDLTDPDHVELKTLRGKVLMEDKSTVTLEAVNGMMDNKQQTLDLHKDIYLQTTTGYEAWLSQAFVDMAKGTVTSDEHVDVKWADGKISADKMKITGGGEVVRFEGNVVMNIDKIPPAADPVPEPAPPPKPAKARPNVKSSNAK